MAIPITVPRLGWNMEQGVFVGWLKADGATIRAGEFLFTLEGEKATEEVECLDSGILHIPAGGPQKGDLVTVGALIGFLLQPGEALPEFKPPPMPSSTPRSASAAARSSMSITPRRARPASSPRARRAAAQLGIDWKQAAGTGSSGRIRERDVRALKAAPGVNPSANRRVIAERMLHSSRSTAPVTLTTTVDATQLVRVRNHCKAEAADGVIVPAFTDLFVKLTGTALTTHPMMTSRWENDRVVSPEGIHIGIAVDTAAGLLVPVVRNVPALTLRELAAQARDLVDRARAATLAARELRDGVFTVTSLGGLGIDAFTPIINHPECAILGVGRIRRVPAVVDDRIVIQDQVTLSLTFDHRIVDGAPAARFLRTLSRLIENADMETLR